jgi:glycyl-tRNA synthetase beta chain
MLKDLVLELYSEEIPALMQLPAAKAFKEIFAKNFSTENVIFEEIDTYVSPCRIIIHCRNISDSVAAQTIEKRGPKTSAPEMAIKAFADSCGKKIEELEARKIKDAEYYFDVSNIASQPVENILPEIIVKSIPEYVWPKSMHWGEYQISWVRPLKNIMCLFGDAVLPLQYGHLKSNNITFGHKFMSEEQIQVENISDYFKQLDSNKVVYDQDIRREKILKQLEEEAKELEVTVNIDEKLLEEVTGLIEYPVVLVGEIDKRFMKIPPEILTCSMKQHQKYFTAKPPKSEKVYENTLAPFFFFVSNMSSRNEQNIIEGNERVLTARLSDAEFFYREDQKISSEARYNKLELVTFHAKLGNMKDKTNRIVKIVESLVTGDGANRILVAARLSKTDLVSGVVGEFPELQGIMGGYYTAYEGLATEVSSSIAQHYKPFGANDELPMTQTAGLISISDKLDSLVGLYIAGERATGSKDPYGLRRYAVGFLRVMMKYKVYCPIKILVETAAEPFGGTEQDIQEIILFIKDRLKNYFTNNNYDVKVVNSLISDFGSDKYNIGDFEPKLEALQDFLRHPEESEKILAIYRRINNILKQNPMDLSDASTEYDKHEQALLEMMGFSFLNSMARLVGGFYRQYFHALEMLIQPIEKFFDNVMVVTDDLETTKRRLSLLKRICECGFDPYANFDEL